MPPEHDVDVFRLAVGLPVPIHSAHHVAIGRHATTHAPSGSQTVARVIMRPVATG